MSFFDEEAQVCSWWNRVEQLPLYFCCQGHFLLLVRPGVEPRWPGWWLAEVYRRSDGSLVRSIEMQRLYQATGVAEHIASTEEMNIRMASSGLRLEAAIDPTGLSIGRTIEGITVRGVAISTEDPMRDRATDPKDPVR